MDHQDPTFPFDGPRGALRLMAVLAAAALLVGVAAHRRPGGTLEPWRTGPTASLVTSPAPRLAATARSSRD